MRSLDKFKTPDHIAMRRTMGRFLTGVAIVTTTRGSEHHGMTINSLTSISLEPPILMVSLTLGARTTDSILESGEFAVSVLSVKQEPIARRFATRGGEHFEGGDFDYTDSGIPVIKDALSQANCRVVKDEVIGDHHVFFGEVIRSRDRDGEGLAFNAGKFGSFLDFGHEEMPWIY